MRWYDNNIFVVMPMIFILACLSTQINAYNNLIIGFDHLGLESLGLTSVEQELSDLAENIVTIQNRDLGIENFEIFQNVMEQKTELPPPPSHHTIVKRGTKSSASPPDNLGYLALPIPPLPPGVSKESTRLFRKPNSKLIELANQLALQKRQGEFSLVSAGQDILPPATNQIFELDDEPVVDPFRLTVNGHENYPNSIQDLLYTNDRPTEPPKQVIYKIVTKTPPPNDFGTTKKIVYKLVTKPPHPATSLPAVPAINTPKPEVIFHTRPPPETLPALVNTKPNQIPNSKKPAKNNGNKGISTHYHPGSDPASSPPTDENYFAVIPYNDITKLFELLNKHTKPMKADHHPAPKKKKKYTTPKPKKSHPTTKKLQPKVIKRTPLGYKKKKKKQKKKKKKKKKVVHVSFDNDTQVWAKI